MREIGGERDQRAAKAMIDAVSAAMTCGESIADLAIRSRQKHNVLRFSKPDDEPKLPAWLSIGRTWQEWRDAWVAWDARQNPIADFARALDSSPKVAEAPFALTAPPNRSTDAAQRDLFS